MFNEPHYTPGELAELWHISDDTVRAIFENEPGIIRIVRPETRTKRGHNSMRIPESVARRKYAEITKTGVGA